MFKKAIIKLAIAMLAVMPAAVPAAAQRVKVTASIDSAMIEMGSRTGVKVSVMAPGDAQIVPVEFPEAEKEYNGVDVVSIKADTADIPDGRRRYDFDMVIQAFYPGVVTMPPFRFANGTDTAASEMLTLKVLEVDLDSLETINPMESIVKPATRWYDYIPDWWIWVVVGLLAVAIGVLLYFIYRRNGTLLPVARKPVIPPYDLAVMELDRLRQEKLAESGHEKEYYTRLIDILRQYLEGRFGINAMEMSSTQILQAIRHNEETRMTHVQMQQILEIADFVKFAKVRPIPEDNIKTFNMARDFVEATRPAPEPEEGDKDNPNPGKAKTQNP